MDTPCTEYNVPNHVDSLLKKRPPVMQVKIGFGNLAEPDFRYHILLLKVRSIQMRSGLMILPNPI